ncbi:ATP-binding protein [Rheinheimera sp. UJ51]|uniref:ATP-binding protein n=1 Tax=Rheinheimera sp. UJ51 TaxID=2892446 RepID=UPI002D1FBA81|nr:ATP-binding protein [Rheinheimera sp. UJ51]
MKVYRFELVIHKKSFGSIKCYEQRSTIIVSQLPVSEWYGLMDNPTVADALLDRVIHNAHRLELTGESQRKKTLVQGEEVG